MQVVLSAHYLIVYNHFFSSFDVFLYLFNAINETMHLIISLVQPNVIQDRIDYPLNSYNGLTSIFQQLISLVLADLIYNDMG